MNIFNSSEYVISDIPLLDSERRMQQDKERQIQQAEEEKERMARIEMPASYMENFINTDDTSEISERKIRKNK